MDETVIAIDPGREKCGVAVVHRTRGTIEQEVVKTSEVMHKVSDLVSKYNLCTVVLGNSTHSNILKEKFCKIQSPQGSARLEVILVDEYRSTDAARVRYWLENPPKGLKRLLPVTMLVPPRPIDDYAAVILAERYFIGEANAVKS